MRKLCLLLSIILAGCGGQGAETAQQGNPNQPAATRKPPPPPTAVGSVPAAVVSTPTSQPPSPSPSQAPTDSPTAPAATAPPTAPAATAPPTAPAATAPVASAAPARPSSGRGAILLNRQGAVWRYDVVSGNETQILPTGRHFRMAPDGSQLAYLVETTLYVAGSDGSNPRELAKGIDQPPVWTPDSTALAVTTGATNERYPLSCNEANEVVVIELPTGTSTSVGAGCQPAWAPESKRIAYITPVEGSVTEGVNSLRLVNRQGANGWTPVSGPVGGQGYPSPRRIFYAPFWRGDGKVLYAFGFEGYHALTDFSILESVDPTNGGTRPIGVALDVMPETVRATGDGSQVAYMVASPKGTIFTASLVTEAEEGVFDYVGTPVTVFSKRGPGIEHGSWPAWSPDGRELAVVYCESEGSICPPSARAEVWLLDSVSSASSPLIKDVDADSHLEWQR